MTYRKLISELITSWWCWIAFCC